MSIPASCLIALITVAQAVWSPGQEDSGPLSPSWYTLTARWIASSFSALAFRAVSASFVCLAIVIVMTFWYVIGTDLIFLNFLNFIFTWD